ncbi:MAG: hypothetical protein ACXV5F_07025 [Halobacteriota archaeon]
MSDKTALVLFSEIVQSLDKIRDVVTEVFEAAEEGKKTQFSEESVQQLDLSTRDVQQLESNVPFFCEEEERAQMLWDGCQKMETEAIELIKVCLEFTPAL